MRGGNSQTSTGFTFLTAFLTDVEGRPLRDAAGRLQPVFEPFASLAVEDRPVVGAQLEIETTTLYLNDRWRWNDRWSFNLGLRWESTDSRTNAGIPPVATDAWQPRLAASWDVGGDGRWTASATWGRYAGRFNHNLFGDSVNVLAPNQFLLLYLGPPGIGLDFAPGLDPASYLAIFALTSDNVAIDPGTSSPASDEWTVSLGRRLGSKGWLEATLVDRSLRDILEDFNEPGRFVVIDLPVGPLPADVFVLRNTDLARRDYRALQLAGRYRPSDRWWIEGHWTWQLRNDGNLEGERPDAPGVVGDLGDYQGILAPERSWPDGRLDDFQRHTIRLWTSYRLELGRAGRLDLSALASFDSARTYSLLATAPLTANQLARNPGYLSPPPFQTIYFGPRGAGEFRDSATLDLAVRWTPPLRRAIEPWIKLDVRNALNDQTLVAWDTTVAPDFAGPVDEHGIWTGFVPAPSFGQPRTAADYVTPRELRLALGVRFGGG